PQDSVPLENGSKVYVTRIGIEDGVEGIIAVCNELLVGNTLIDSLHNIYVVHGDGLVRSSHIGVPINGILGSHFFEDYMIKVDYLKKRISIYDAYEYPEKLTNKFTRLPVLL